MTASYINKIITLGLVICLYLSHTLGYDQLRPAATSKFSVVFGSLLEVADDRAMVTADPQWSLVVFMTSLRPNGRREVFSSPLSVGECRTMVFSGRHNISLVFRSWRSLIVGDWSVAGRWPRSATTRRPLGDCPKYHQILIFVCDWSPICKRSLSTAWQFVETSRCSCDATV